MNRHKAGPALIRGIAFDGGYGITSVSGSVILPIPGTSKVDHLKENVWAAAIKLTDAEFETLDRSSGRKS